jgi:7-cyano-7-deazaguanine reductase
MSPVSIPESGPLPEPGDPAEAAEYLREARFAAPDLEEIVLEALEFTSICPKTGQPDFGTVTIRYQPGSTCIESRSLKYYLWSYRDHPAFCEALAATIADDVMRAIEPRRVEVTVTHRPRGGISISACAVRGADKH